MNDIDNRIGGALDADDRAFLARLEEDRGLFRQMGDAMHGPLGGWAKLIFAMLFVVGAAFVYSLWQFFEAEGIERRITWATAVIGLLVFQGFAKEWFFARMNTNAILREVKRLQVLVAAKE